MKVRLEDQRVVYRLNEMERGVLSEKGHLGIVLSLGGEQIDYRISIQKGASRLDYSYAEGKFTMLFPQNYLNRWDEEKVGFEDVINGLYLVVEKDLKRSKKR